MKLVKKTKVSIQKEVYWDMTIPKNHNYVLGNGNLVHNTGCGYSVESKYVNQLPEIAESFYPTDTVIIVNDSKLGWAKSFKELIALLYTGQIPGWDTSKVRAAGTPLKTFGGRASGPEPLEDLFRFTVELFKNAVGRKLTTLEAHDLCCKIASVVVVGGVRRSAMISGSDLNDIQMRNAKSGQWWEQYMHRSLANNSAVYNCKPDMETFFDEWHSLYKSKSGERGIINREGLKKHVAKFGRREVSEVFFVNPCGEIILLPFEFCNLTEVVIRKDDTPETLKKKVRIATILGTFQSTLTNFKYIRQKWRDNCEEERLLGVSLTGIMDNAITNYSDGDEEKLAQLLMEMRQLAVDVNAEFAEMIGINKSAAITTVKPSGTVSSLVNSGSGVHARYAPYYVRTVRADKKDPLAQMMKDMGFPAEDDFSNPSHNWVFSFPIQSPNNAVCTESLSAIDQLEIWKLYRTYWTEHNVSVTISVKDHEWMEVGAWVFDHFDDIGGVSFLPYAEHTYKQAPYQQIDKETYEKLVSEMPFNVDWNQLSKYENTDLTEGAQELACSGGVCDLTDLTKK